jgi:phospholipase/carboxylesterase
MDAVKALTIAVSLFVILSCNTLGSTDMVKEIGIYKNGRLSARPNSNPKETHVSTGTLKIATSETKDNFIFVPKHYTGDKSSPLAVMLHGAGGNAKHGISYLQNYAEENNILILSLSSHEYSWDVIADRSFGRDVKLLDSILKYVLNRYNVDENKIAIGGFSDGASYALSLGVINGDLFTHIIAFSPGFVHATQMSGSPEIFVSHGKSDRVLPVHQCSRRIVSELGDRYKVRYLEFEGQHEIPANIASSAVAWFLR